MATSRKELLARGWYVVTDVQTAFLGLSGKAHDLLIILKHFQGDNTAATPDQKRLAAITGWSVKTVERTLRELATKGALTSQRTGRANRYSAVHILGSPEEIRVLMGADIEIPPHLVASDPTPGDVSDQTTDGGFSSYKEPLQNQNKNLLPSGGGDAAAPHPEGTMGIAGYRPKGEYRDEFDPAASLGLWESQESPEEPAGDLDALFPADEVTPAPTARQRRPQTQAQADSAGSLAYHFEQLVRQQPWAGPSPVNKAALARNLSAWKRDGLSADQIRAMMDRYASADFPRRTGKAPWIDFLAQRHKLIAVGARAQQAQSMEAHRHDGDASYWLGSMAGGR